MSANSDRDRNCDHGDDLDVSAYALDQLDEAERAELEHQLSESSGDGHRVVEQTRRLAEKVREALAADNPAASTALRETLVHRMSEPCHEAAKPTLAAKPQTHWRRHAAEFLAVSLVVGILAAVVLPGLLPSRHAGTQVTQRQSGKSSEPQVTSIPDHEGFDPSKGRAHLRSGYEHQDATAVTEADVIEMPLTQSEAAHEAQVPLASTSGGTSPPIDPNFHRFYKEAGGYRGRNTPNQDGAERSVAGAGSGAAPAATGDFPYQPEGAVPGGGTPGGDNSSGGKAGGQLTDPYGAATPASNGKSDGQRGDGWYYKANNFQGQHGGAGQGRGLGKGTGIGERPVEAHNTYQRLGGRHDGRPIASDFGGGEGQPADPRAFGALYSGMAPGGGAIPGMIPGSGPGTEQYAPIVENAFIPVQGIDALSTFSIDVDTASYANVRRFLTQGQRPPPDAVRLEELVNYFSYDYPQPKAGEPFSVNMEMAECPWQAQHLLLRVGLKGREIHAKERPVSNLVFLLDVSGSMADENKLPLLKQVLSMLVRELREDDRVSIVTYAGEAGLRLPPTTGDQQGKILAAIDSLASGGSTNGSAGIELAYDQAQAYFRKEGTNRVILATDGDLNVGVTDDESLVQLIKQKATGGTFLTVLGFGEGNLKDAKMERLADNGNGLYAYIDSVREGRKVLVEQMSGSLVTIAKDVKVQIEFNPAQIQSYRLLGYENRMLTAPEFNDDKRDAGEIGAGHSVTALYELAPTGLPPSPGTPPGATDPLKYQSNRISGISGDIPHAGSLELSEAAKSGELLTVKLRYKEPAGEASKLTEYPLKSRGGKFNAASKDFQFAAAVASFGMQLRSSQYRGEGNLSATAEIASGAIGEDKGGYRAEFVDLVRKAQALGVK